MFRGRWRSRDRTRDGDATRAVTKHPLRSVGDGGDIGYGSPRQLPQQHPSQALSTPAPDDMRESLALYNVTYRPPKSSSIVAPSESASVEALSQTASLEAR